MASRGALDAIASIETCQSRGLGSTRSPSNAHAQRRTVDHVSDTGRSRLNRALRIVGRHVAAPGDVDQDRTYEICRIVGSWPTIVA